MDHLDQAILLRQVALLLVRITLPLSGRQGAWGGAAESLRRPVHSRGLLEGTGSACCMFLVLHLELRAPIAITFFLAIGCHHQPTYLSGASKSISMTRYSRMRKSVSTNAFAALRAFLLI